MFKRSYAAIKEILSTSPLHILQRLGWDSKKRRLEVDDKEGNNTVGGTYFLPEVEHTLVKVALGELLSGAQEFPIGRNSGPWVAKYYYKPKETTVKHGAWCAAFVGWCLRQAFGTEAPYSWSARRLFKRVCDWEYGTRIHLEDVQVGDILLWSRDAAGPYNGHTGIVCGLDEVYVYVIEGNSGPFVRIFRYRRDADLRSSTDPCLGAVRVSC